MNRFISGFHGNNLKDTLFFYIVCIAIGFAVGSVLSAVRGDEPPDPETPPDPPAAEFSAEQAMAVRVLPQRPRVLFMSAARNRQIMLTLPKTEMQWFEDAKPRMSFYDEASLPQAYQDGIAFNRAAGAFQGKLVSISFNPNQRNRAFGQPNLEFPWKNTAGLEGTTATAKKFVVFPETGRIDWSHDGQRIRWVYPNETTFGEVLYLKDRQGRDYPFEVRLRTRQKFLKWEIDVLRPFADRSEFVKAVEHRQDNRLVFLGRPVRAFDREHARTSFDREGFESFIPELQDETVRALLGTPFKRINGHQWAPEASAFPSWAPTTNSDFSIVPKNYFAAMVRTRQSNCMDCHKDTGLTADEIGPDDRYWHGRVRGSDNIFTLHPFSADSVQNGEGVHQIRFRKELLDADLILPPQSSLPRQPVSPIVIGNPKAEACST